MAFDVQISTDRLILRPIRIQDSERIFRYRSSAVANRYQGWIPLTISDVDEFINQKISAQINIPDTWFQLAILTKDTGNLIGDIGIHFLKSEPSWVELGVTLDLDFQGQGFATEALTGIISYLFDELNKRLILVCIDPKNVSSIKLFERLGFRRQVLSVENEVVRAEWPDDLVFAIDRDEWSG
jgi:RimJ/RimL family protein N-acetyltransferase